MRKSPEANGSAMPSGPSEKNSRHERIRRPCATPRESPERPRSAMAQSFRIALLAGRAAREGGACVLELSPRTGSSSSAPHTLRRGSSCRTAGIARAVVAQILPRRMRYSGRDMSRETEYGRREDGGAPSAGYGCSRV